jgi:hypothetical protein
MQEELLRVMTMESLTEEEVEDIAKAGAERFHRQYTATLGLEG